jgi:hypothetical protein
MPSKQRDPQKPTVYLDQSTLSDAFRAHHSGVGRLADPAYLPLLQWIGRVAAEANLCISSVHLLELAGWVADEPMADAICAWLDALPTVSVASLQRVQLAEEEGWVRRATSVETQRADPFLPSIAALFPIAPDISQRLLSRPQPLVALLVAMRELRGRYDNLAPDHAARVRADRVAPEHAHVTSERGASIIELHHRQDLARRATSAAQRLRSSGMLPDSCTDQQVLHTAFALYESDESELPLYRIQKAYGKGLAEGIERRTAGSAKDVKALSGAAEDGLHLVGAAYCDVFTCDRATSLSIGDVRQRIGRRPQLAVGGHPGGAAGFVGDLMATWP